MTWRDRGIIMKKERDRNNGQGRGGSVKVTEKDGESNLFK